MIASLDQCIVYQVKCDRSIYFGAAKREVVVKTATTTKKTTITTTVAVVAKYIQNNAQIKKTQPKPFSRTQAEFLLKTEILSMTEHLQRNPAYEKGQGRPLPARENLLANQTTVKLSRKKVQKL